MRTLENGIRLLENLARREACWQEVAFQLYDTFGFPLTYRVDSP